MATDTTLPLPGFSGPRPSPDDLAPDRPVRPAKPARGPGKLLRKLIGVREDVMDWVPEDRPKYAWFGVIVLNTALLGGVSMAVALSTVRAELALPVKVLIAAAWFWVVLGLDSWLVSSTHGVGRHRRLTLAPRLLLSVLLSLFIAEPLLLQIFDKEITHQIQEANRAASQAYRGNLVLCNPTDGSANLALGCKDFQLGVPGSPVELRRLIAQNTADVTAAQTAVDSYDDKIRAMQKEENDQCAIANFVWRSNGNRSESDPCLTIQGEIHTFQKANDVNALTSRLTKAKDDGAALAAQAGTAATSYQGALHVAMDKAAAAKTAAQDTKGLLTRADALAAVSWSTWYAAFVVVLLHIILLVVDAMPVLAKLMSGATAYDRTLSRRQEANRELYEIHLEVEKACTAADYEFEKHRRTQAAEARRRRIDHELQVAESERAREFRMALDARTARLLAAQS